jgi:hypothetical protein
MIISGKTNVHTAFFRLFGNSVEEHNVEHNGIYTTLDNKYIPLFIIAGLRTIIQSDSGKREMIYNDYEITVDDSILCKQKNFNDCLRNYCGRRYTSRWSNIVYYLNKNSVFFINKEFNIEYLLVTVIDADYFLNNFSIKNSTSIDTSKLLTLVSYELIENEEHKHISTKLKEYLKWMKDDVDVDIVYTTNINKWCFNPAHYTEKFASIDEMEAILSNTYKLLT